MSHDSIRNKALVQFEDGRLMLLCEVSCSNVYRWDGKRVWDKCLVHPDNTLFYTKESLKKAQTDYVEKQLKWLRDFNKEWYDKGYVDHYEEPTVESPDYCGTVFPGGSRVRNGRAFYGGRSIPAEEYFSKWDCAKRIEFSVTDRNMKTIYSKTYDLREPNLDEKYREACKHGHVYIGIR